MPHRKAKKETGTASRASTTKKVEAAAAAASKAVARATKEETERAELAEWIDKNDPLYDRSGAPPVTISELLSTKLLHRTFTKEGMGEMPYNWSRLRGILEARTPTSPRWFMQLREEDLLIDGGLDGVTVDCVVIAEASVPTLAPAHYIVKQHMPYSDLEDNAPERILPIEGQGMCWRRVVRDDGGHINAYLLQKREVAATAPVSFGFGTSAPSASAQTATPATSSSTAPANGFGFGFGTAPVPADNNSNVPANFGFGSSVAAASAGGSSATSPGSGFGFGFGTTSLASDKSHNGNAPTGVNASTFGFGAAKTNDTATPVAAGASALDALIPPASQVVSPLKPSEVLFALWSKKRLAEMTKSLKSGSRIVLEDFKPNPMEPSIKLVMQNDLKDNVAKTVRHLVLNKIFAKRCDKIVAVDRWIDACPVYEEHLGAALQKFRANYVQETAEASEEFSVLYNECRTSMEAVLQRIVGIRKEVVHHELHCIEHITQQVKEGKIAQKQTFRLLKHYAENDVMRFRPFGKVSGISEMGESADVCEPPAPVFVNPFAAARPHA